MDATGSLVRKFTDQKRSLLYCIVFKDGDDPSQIIPLASAILCDHSVPSIAYFLNIVRKSIVTIADKFIRPSFIVIDFSPAILNALLQTFNNEGINLHLKRCWNVLLKTYSSEELFAVTYIRFCCAHVMKAFSRSLKAAQVKKDTRKQIMHLFAFILLSMTLDQAMQLLNAVIQIFGDSYNTDSPALLQRFWNIGLDDSTMKIISEDENDGQQQQQELDPLEEVDETKISSKAIIHQSPFNVEARKQIPDLVNLYSSDKSIPSYVSKIGPGQLSNAIVESYFGIVKECILRDTSRLRPAQLVLNVSQTSAITDTDNESIRKSARQKTPNIRYRSSPTSVKRIAKKILLPMGKLTTPRRPQTDIVGRNILWPMWDIKSCIYEGIAIYRRFFMQAD
ncbi:unnamed protein product [Didymodactylos carnosus]|uniref:Transposase n=1 Tax=Didymodactylos carnosus TaxID=1234261 RepID=A0A815CJG6_9BILA|nr:unnamed protein product [Didymodactylos carnosus]CAF4083080.1 unnamed protein product [Didymodactylos carnosus]